MQIILDVHRHRKIKHKPLRNRSQPYSNTYHIIVISAGLPLDLIPPDVQLKRTENLYEIIFGEAIPHEQLRQYAVQMDAISYITE